MLYRFEDFELDEERFELRRGETVIDIEPQSLRLLLRLVAARGAVVDRETLFREVLGVEFASDDALFKAVQRARRAVADDGRNQRLVKTVPGRGYRFVGAFVEPAVTEPVVAPDPTGQSPASRRAAPRSSSTRRSTLAVTLAVLAFGTAAIWIGSATRRDATGAGVALDLEHLTPEQIEEVWRSLPSSATVATTVVDALRLLRLGDPRAALKRLEPVHRDAPEDPFVLAALARIRWTLGDVEGASASARAAIEVAQRLPAVRRLDLDALLLETEGDLDGAAARYEALFALAPERPLYALAALRCRVESGRADLHEELAEVEARLALHELSEQTAMERLWLQARLHGNGGRFIEQIEAAERLEQEAGDRGSSGYVARARWLRIEALQKSGNLDEALALAAEPPGLDGLPDAADRLTLVQARDHAYRGRGGAAWQLLDTLRARFETAQFGSVRSGTTDPAPNLPLQLAVEADAARLALLRRDLTLAELLGARAIEKARRLGHRGRLAALLRQQADVFADASRFDEAEELYLETLAQHRRDGDSDGEASVLLGLGLLHRQAGEPYLAAERLVEAAELYDEVGRRDRASVVLYNLASVHVSLCRLEAAREALEGSRAIEEELQQPGGVAWALHGLSLVSLEAGELDAAAEQIQQAVALRRGLGDDAGIVGSEVRLALILDRSDRSSEALAVLDRLLEGPLQQPSETRNLALNLRSHALIHLGQLDAAAQNIAASRRANAEIRVAFSPTLTDLAAAELAIQQASFESARDYAARARDRAEQFHDLAALVEARRLLLEAEHGLGLHPAATQIEQARSLVDDAGRMGCRGRGRDAEAWLARVRSTGA